MRTYVPTDERRPLPDAITSAQAWKAILPDETCTELHYYYDDMKVQPLWRLSAYTEAEFAAIDPRLPLLMKKLSGEHQDVWVDSSALVASLQLWQNTGFVIPLSAFPDEQGRNIGHHVQRITDISNSEHEENTGIVTITYQRFVGLCELDDSTTYCVTKAQCTRRVYMAYLDGLYPGWHKRYQHVKAIGLDVTQTMDHILQPLPTELSIEPAGITF